MSACTYTERLVNGAILHCGYPGIHAVAINGVHCMRCDAHAPFWTHERRKVAARAGMIAAACIFSGFWLLFIRWLVSP